MAERVRNTVVAQGLRVRFRMRHGARATEPNEGQGIRKKGNGTQ
jgi:hypothetical protein